MKIYEYIRIMKEAKPVELDYNNIWQQFYETNDLVVQALLDSKKIDRKQAEKLWMVNENIAGEIVLSWLRSENSSLEMMLVDRKGLDLIYYDVCKCYKPENCSEKHLLISYTENIKK